MATDDRAFDSTHYSDVLSEWNKRLCALSVYPQEIDAKASQIDLIPVCFRKFEL